MNSFATTLLHSFVKCMLAGLLLVAVLVYADASTTTTQQGNSDDCFNSSTGQIYTPDVAGQCTD